MVLDLASKAVKAVATGNAQADMGVQSPHLAAGLTRLGRFAYTFSGIWIGVTWYTCYANTKTEPGSGPSLVLPNGKKGQYGPSRDDPQVSGLLGKLGGSSSNGKVGRFGNSDPSVAGPARMRVAKVALQMVGASNMHYAEIRPIPSNILANPNQTDCSGFVEQVYYTCKCPDPSGLGFQMPLAGDTGTQEAHGTPVQSPNIGDLAFWSNPDHVAIVVSLNPVTIVSNGGPIGAPPIKELKSAEDGFHSSFLGYRSYL